MSSKSSKTSTSNMTTAELIAERDRLIRELAQLKAQQLESEQRSKALDAAMGIRDNTPGNKVRDAGAVQRFGVK